MNLTKMLSLPKTRRVGLLPAAWSERLGVGLIIEVALLAVTFGATIYAFVILGDAMTHRGPGGDEGYFSWGGWSIRKGLAPYREFLDFKPPMIFLTHALAQKLYGIEGLAYRKFFVLFPLGSVLALQLSLLTRRIDKWMAMALALAVVQMWVNPSYHDTALSDAESIGLAYYFYGVAFLLARTNARRVTRVIGGAFLTLCAFSKEPFVPCIVFTWVSAFLMEEESAAYSRRRALEYVRDTGIGIGFVVACLVAYMAPTGALTAYLAMARRYTLVYADPNQSFCVLGGIFEPTTPMNDLVRAWDAAKKDFINFPTLGFLLPFAAAYFIYVPRRSPWLFAMSSLSAFFALYAIHATNCQWMHYYTMTLSGMFLCLVIGLDSMRPYFDTGEAGARRFARFALLAGPLTVVLPRIDAERPQFGKRAAPHADMESVPGSLRAIREHTTEDDRIFTTGNPFLYVEADRLSAAREAVHLDPLLPWYEGTTDRERLRPVFDQLVKNRPKIVITDPEFGPRKVRIQEALLEPFLAQYHYKQIAPFIYLRED